ncbi:MAG: oligopeptide/dipeptide transporter, ATPase subunit [Geminicoccaceae bacterium]|jgi:oligopeptide/dipeptide ABC transporter ATP-binding protein|nr:oligopeptide/dipeptide transporter, ATPase subunit [Geminicoccaceae bacterium]
MSALLSVRDLSVEFPTRQGPVRAVQALSFHIARGDTLALVGESGSGKSTVALALLRLIASPGRIVSGEILFDGRDLTALSEEAIREVRGRDIAMIFQDPMMALNPVHTIGTQIAEAVRLHLGGTKAEGIERAVELLRLVRVPAPERRVREYPHNLSGGMRQRAMIAMALACNPKLLVADEPTTALDVTIQAQVLELIRELKERLHMAMLLITHDLGVVAESAERVVVMYAGRKVEEGAVREMFRKPHHPYTEGLIKVSRWESSGGGEMPEIPGTVPSPVELPPGCSFAPRCAYAMPACSREQPPLFDLADGRSSACFLPKADRP